MSGSLFLVATPLGNLDDLSFRALRTLKEAAVIACEDTRQTHKLLTHFEIDTPTISYHEHNETARTPELIARLLAGDSVALVSDAGTPLVSDPGFRLVAATIEKGIPVVPIPGPSAAVTALAASGLPTHAFRFGGFLPSRSSQRRAELANLKNEPNTLIFYEAPHRLLDTLGDIEEILGPGRPVVVAREITKIHEEFLRGAAAEVRSLLAARPGIKGEITLLIGAVAKRTQPPDRLSPNELLAEVHALVAAGAPRMDAIKQVARRHRLGKREVYRLLPNEPGSVR